MSGGGRGMHGPSANGCAAGACCGLAIAIALVWRGAGERAGAAGQACSSSTARPTRRPRPASPRSRQLGAATTSVSTAPPRGATSRRQPRRLPRPSCSSTPPGNLLNSAQEGALQDFVEGGGGFLGIGSAAQAEPGARVLRRADRRAPGAASPPRHDRADVASATASTRRRVISRSLWNRSDVWYQWQTRPTGKVHTVARYHAPTRPPATAPTSAAPTSRSRGAGTCSGGRSFYTGMGRTADELRRGRLQEAPARRHRVVRRPAARQLQGDDRRQLQRRAHRQRRRVDHRPRHQRRVARPRRRAQRLGPLHRPRRLPHRRRARRAARRQAARRASSTTPTRTSASAAATSTSGIPTSTPAPSTAA